MEFDDPATGKSLLYWGSGFQPIKVQELAPDRMSFAAGSAPVDLVPVVKDDPHEYRQLVEGAWVIRRDGWYYMFYSGNNCCGPKAHYAVLVARSRSATGPFEMPHTAIPSSSRHAASGVAPGHNAIITDASGRDWIVYHAVDSRRAADRPKGRRQHAADHADRPDRVARRLAADRGQRPLFRSANAAGDALTSIPMSLPAVLSNLRLPMIGAPLFIISNPKLVIAQCTAGIVGSFPALNARPAEKLDEWLHEITEALAAHDAKHPDTPSAPFAVNQIVHRSNDRLEHDMEVCAKWKVPIVISSLGARTELNDAVHSWGGITLHDIIDDRFARKAIEKGADGLIAVAAGAGGHAGRWSPFALVHEIRSWFDGPLILSGAIATGGAVLAAQAMGADLAYVGSPFIATPEANSSRRVQGGDRRSRRRRYRQHRPLHRRARQLSALVDRRLRA